MVNAVQAAAQDNSRGVLKRQIEAGNLQAILGIVNKNMYTFPEASAIRETTTNAVDSVLEKQQAIGILTGKLKVEDVYIQRESEDPQYRHSQFDKDYYNLAHLSSDNTVYVTYIEGDGVGHDTIEIKDFGVGLSDVAGLSGKPRIIGIHNSSFSTKRNSYGTFGAFGLGAKSPLAMANSYIIKTVYNGRKYELDCGEHYTKSLIGPFSHGKANKLFEWQAEGVKWYYEETNEPNGVTVSIPCKVVQRQEVINAIKQQLLFMSNVKYYYKPYNQTAYEVDFHGKKAYESRNIVISETPTYNVPHIIIVKDPDKDTHDNAVCYGVINWAKLDMPLLKGCVGIKVPIRVVTHDEEGNQLVLREGVEVNPSRETVIWNDVTAKYIKHKLEEVSKEVTKILEEKLKTDNILEFIRLRTSFITGSNNKSQYLAVAELAKLVNPTQWDLNFKGLKISELSYLSVSLQKNKAGVKYISKQFNTSIGYSTEFGNCPVYLVPKDVEIDNKVVRYLIKTHDKSVHFVYMDFFNFKANLPQSQQVSFQIIPVNYAKFVEYVKQSGEAKMYSADLLPADYVEEAEEEQAVAKPISLSPEELRKQNNEVLIYAPKYSFSHWISEGVYTFAKTTIKRKDLVSYGQDELTKGSICYYGTEEDRELLNMTVSLIQPLHRGYRNYAGLEALTDVLANLQANNSLVYSTRENSYRFILVSQQVKNIIKKLPNYKHISLFSQDITIKDNNLKMELAQEIIAYNTAKYLHDKLPQLKFLTNYADIDADKAEKYHKLRAYCEDHYLLTPFHSHYSAAYVRPLEALHTSLDKINEAQLALRSMTEDPESSEQILSYVKTILGLDDSIKSLQITGLDLYYVDLAQELVDYSLTIKDMLNYVSVLIEEDKNIEQNTLDLIRLFVKTIKG